MTTTETPETRGAGGNLSYPSSGSSARQAHVDAYGQAFGRLSREHYALRDAIWADKPRVTNPNRRDGWTPEWQAWKNRLTAEGVRYAHAKKRLDREWDEKAERDGIYQ